MAKPTLLEIVQEVLEEMDGDEVNSIGGTIESTQVSNLVKTTYTAMMSNRNWPHTRRALTLTARSDTDYPTHIVVDDNVKELISINYDKALTGETRKKYRKLEWQDPDVFLHLTNNRNNDDSTVDLITDDSGIEILIRNDKHPQYYTSFDDTNIIFDSYDNTVDTTIQQSKIQSWGYIIPVFTLSDSFVPDLPEEAFASLKEEVKSKAQFKYRQFQDIKSEQEAGRQSRWLSRKAWRVGGGIKYPNYGRKRRKPTSSMDIQLRENR